MEQPRDGRTPLLPPSSPAELPRRNKYSFFCAVLASMTSVLMGYNVAVMSGAQIFIQDDLGITDTQIEVLSGAINILSLAGALLAGWTSDVLGRRLTIALTNGIFLVGPLLMALAGGYTALMVGRSIAGIGVGYALVIAPVYAAEIAPASSRGLLSSLPEVVNLLCDTTGGPRARQPWAPARAPLSRRPEVGRGYEHALLLACD